VVAPEEHQERIIAIDHVFDAFVAALVVRCHELGLTAPVPTEHREVARREGWILLPTPGSLERLAHV
jgi:hypothetical protein